jgi:uncharacterized protein YbbK (DUF523 family)/uncharacterized protein YbgA (DUF1722 family)
MSDEYEQRKITIGVSGCLVGQTVRHDGGHKRDRYLVGELSRVFDFMPFCPEVAAGLGVPRKTIRLVGEVDHPRVLEPATGTDRTEALRAAADDLVARVERSGLSGFVLKAKSPSCGMERVPVYRDNGVPERNGRGVFARALKERLPDLPIEEEGRLNDPRLRENFLLRVFTYQRFSDEVRAAPSKHALLRFHAAHKMLLLAHNERRGRKLGRWLANADDDIETLVEHYSTELFAALARPASRRQHQNALHHMAGFARDFLDDDERRELDRVIRSYGEGHVPLAVPVSLLRLFHLRDANSYGAQQRYVEPHPPPLALYSSI